MVGIESWSGIVKGTGNPSAFFIGATSHSQQKDEDQKVMLTYGELSE